MLSIKRFWNRRELTLVLRGSLDRMSSEDLLEEIHKDGLKDVDKLIFDMEEVEYISSAGLRVILIAEKAMENKGELTIRNMKPMVKKIFEDVGFNRFLDTN